MALLACATNRHQGQHAVWSGPYFSGAANFSPTHPFRWIVCPEELAHYRDLPRSEQVAHRFQPCSPGTAYKYNSIGFLWIVYMAKMAFPWLPDQQAVVALQLIVHSATALLVLWMLGDILRRSVFVVAYACNPLVLYFVQFPYEYFWTSLASLAFLLALFSKKWTWPAMALLVTASLVIFHIRPPVAPLLLLTPLVLAVRHRKLGYTLAVPFLLALMMLTNYQHKQAWHTAYVGLGAYPNAFVHGLSDDNGYVEYEAKTGVRLKMSSPSDNYYDEAVYDDYQRVLKDEYLRIVRDSPLNAIRNASLNLLQSFSFGYPVARAGLAYASAAAGAVVVVLLLLTAQYWLLLGIAAVSAGFALYFPPIPAYMFGGYMLLAVGVAEATKRLWRSTAESGYRVSA